MSVDLTTLYAWTLVAVLASVSFAIGYWIAALRKEAEKQAAVDVAKVELVNLSEWTVGEKRHCALGCSRRLDDFLGTRGPNPSHVSPFLRVEWLPPLLVSPWGSHGRRSDVNWYRLTSHWYYPPMMGWG